MNAQPTTTWYVIPCGRTKLDRPAPAGSLYTGAHFQFVRAGVTAHVERVQALADDAPARGEAYRHPRLLIMSALHGLVMPGQFLAPYDVTFRDPGAITPRRLADTALTQGFAPGDRVVTFLPITYREHLKTALGCYIDVDLATTNLTDAYARCMGIGMQRRVIAQLAALTDDQVRAGDVR